MAQHCIKLKVWYNEGEEFTTTLHRLLASHWVWAPQIADGTMPRLVIKEGKAGIPRTEIPAMNIRALFLEPIKNCDLCKEHGG